MTKKQLENKDYWNNYNLKYTNNWKGRTKKALSKRELSFIHQHMKLVSRPQSVLDIGVGNGRILDFYVANSHVGQEFFGVDIAEKMVDMCKKKFIRNNQVKKIKTCDLSKEEWCFNQSFDFISAIRVLKYNENWTGIIKKVYKKLNRKGIFVFTVLNSRSLSRFANYGTRVQLTNIHELKKILEELDCEVLSIKSFSKLPHYFYSISNNALYAKLLVALERMLEFFLGGVFFGKILFVAVKK